MSKDSFMDRRWLIATCVLCVGCSRTPTVNVETEQPKPISTDFGRLPNILDDIRDSSAVVIYEGLPNEFWEPQLLEQEISQQKTVRMRGYPFYEERLAPQGMDADQLTSLLSAQDSFHRFQSQKKCGGYHADYGIEWKKGDKTTLALISLECGEVKFFGPRSELHCDLQSEAGQKLAQQLKTYQKKRPAAESGE